MDNFNTKWFDIHLNSNEEYTILKQHPTAYFCAEFALTDTLPVYSGGLGVLAGDIIKEADELGIPFVGVGLLYKKGFFKQAINSQGNQEEIPQPINPRTAGLTLLLNSEGNVFTQSIPINKRKLSFQVWHFKVGTIDMYFLDTDIEANNEEDRKITETLYGGDANTRILQEIILGIGGEKALFAQGIYPSIYHMNEGHSAFAAFGIMHHYMKLKKVSYNDAYNEIKKKLIFTNHTLLPAGNDIFPVSLVIDSLCEYAEEVCIPLDEFIKKGTIETNMFSMTIFAMNMSYKINAVSIIHSQKAAELWPQVEMLPITNGVNMKTWISPILRNVLENIALENSIEFEESIDHILREVLWETHQHIKENLLKEILNITGSILDKDILTVTWGRRIAKYKQPDLIFLDIEKIKYVIKKLQRPVQFIITGKPHPKDEEGKAILHNILENIKKINEPNRIVFVPNYSLSIAQFLVSGSDLWLNTPQRGYEACGTSGMKSGANGVLQFTVKDGWADEVNWEDLGWVIDSNDPSQSLYYQLEEPISAEYYNKENNIPYQWIDRMINTMKLVIKNYSSKRMLLDYFNRMYTPSLEIQEAKAIA